MVVLMHRRRGGVTGVYRCKIPVQNGSTQVYVGVYTADTGEYSQETIFVTIKTSSRNISILKQLDYIDAHCMEMGASLDHMMSYVIS